MTHAIRWIMPALAALLVSCGTEAPVPSKLVQRGDRELGVSMMLWYGFEPGTGNSVGGLGSEHWNSRAIASTGLQDPVAVVTDQGFYISDDPAVIALQVSQMQGIGVDWIMTNWWGWGDDDLDSVVNNLGRQAIDRAHTALFDHLESRGGSVKAAIAM